MDIGNFRDLVLRVCYNNFFCPGDLISIIQTETALDGTKQKIPMLFVSVMKDVQ